MRSLNLFSLGLLANFGLSHPPLFSNPRDDHYLQRSRREINQPLAADSELGAELSFLYDICSRTDFETHVLKNSDNTSISCNDRDAEGSVSCQLDCDRGYYVSETVEDSRYSSVSFKCYRLPFARELQIETLYWTYVGSDDQANYKKCVFNACPSGVDLGSSLFQFKDRFSKRATATITVNRNLIYQKFFEAGISASNSDFANDGWTIVVQFNQALSANSKTSFHVGNGRYLSTNKNGDAIAFTSFEENRDIVSLGNYTLELTFSSVEDGFLPADFAVKSIEIKAGEFTNVQCRFGHKNITSAGIWSEDLGYTVSLSNGTQIIEADFDENVFPFEFGVVYTKLTAGGVCELDKTGPTRKPTIQPREEWTHFVTEWTSPNYPNNDDDANNNANTNHLLLPTNSSQTGWVVEFIDLNLETDNIIGCHDMVRFDARSTIDGTSINNLITYDVNDQEVSVLNRGICGFFADEVVQSGDNKKKTRLVTCRENRVDFTLDRACDYSHFFLGDRGSDLVCCDYPFVTWSSYEIESGTIFKFPNVRELNINFQADESVNDRGVKVNIYELFHATPK